MFEHTPGPWSVGNSRQQAVDSRLGPMFEAAVHVGEKSNRGNCLASVCMGGLGALYSTKEAVEANAKLIAAAPDMADLLVKIGTASASFYPLCKAILEKAGYTFSGHRHCFPPCGLCYAGQCASCQACSQSTSGAES